jgi:hypothetical protein
MHIDFSQLFIQCSNKGTGLWRCMHAGIHFARGLNSLKLSKFISRRGEVRRAVEKYTVRVCCTTKRMIKRGTNHYLQIKKNEKLLAKL